MKTAIVTLCLLLCTTTVTANDRFTVRDNQGRIVQTITVRGNQAVIRDRSGRITGTMTTKGNTIQYRNARGQIGK